MAPTTPLLPSDLGADDGPSPAPAPPRAATRFRLPYHYVACLTILTALFAVAVRNSRRCDGWFGYLAYLICTYVLLVACLISIQCAVQFPRGSAAATYGRTVFFVSLAGIFVACLFRPVILYV